MLCSGSAYHSYTDPFFKGNYIYSVAFLNRLGCPFLVAAEWQTLLLNRVNPLTLQGYVPATVPNAQFKLFSLKSDFVMWPFTLCFTTVSNLCRKNRFFLHGDCSQGGNVQVTPSLDVDLGTYRKDSTGITSSVTFRPVVFLLNLRMCVLQNER